MAKTPKAQPAAKAMRDELSAALRASFLRQNLRQKSATEGRAAKKDDGKAKAKTAKDEARRKADSALGDSRYPRSPLAPKSLPEMPAIEGMSIATAATGVKYKGRDDLLIALFDEGTSVAGVFTRSSMASAPVEWCRANLEAGDAKARALVVNAGKSNAFTGKAGAETVKDVAAAMADLVDCRRRDVFQASTGVIGVPFPAQELTRHFERMIAKAGPGGITDAARAIMTTDTFPKVAARTAKIDGTSVQLAGIAKGSGMIAPDMATMLSFMFTDAAVPSPVLQTLLVLTVRETFNLITVDGDTSTSDTVLLFATGKAGNAPIARAGDARLNDFRDQLHGLMEDLAEQVVRDGEGASKLIRVRVKGAESAKSARTVAFAIGNSPLVKTAVAGEDANWGRVVAAVGKSGEKADRDKLGIKFGGLPVATRGAIDPKYDERALSDYMTGQEIEIEVDLGVGKGEAEIWTCDFTHGYISINADYRS